MLQNTIISNFLPDVYLETKGKRDISMHHERIFCSRIFLNTFFIMWWNAFFIIVVTVPAWTSLSRHS